MTDQVVQELETPPGLQEPSHAAAAEQEVVDPEPDAAPEHPEPSAPEEEGWQPVKPKRRGRPPGSKNKPKIVAIALSQR